MKPRFFQHDSTNSFTETEFKSLLGPDVAHESHPVAQLHIVREFSLPRSLGLTAIIHDWGEIDPSVGDVRFGTDDHATHKPKEAERRMQCFLSLMGSQNRQYIDDIENHFNPATEYGMLFKLSERLGYMKTILRAYELYASGKFYDQKASVLRSISADARYHIKPLQDASSEVSSIGVYMNKIDPILTDLSQHIDL